MSIATLKKKTQAKYNLSGRSQPNNAFVINVPSFGASGVVITNKTGGFSINGPHRNVGGVGKNSLFSKDPLSSTICCADTSHTVKPSVLSQGGVIKNRKRWKKTPFTASELHGFPLPNHNQLQKIYNNWVGGTSDFNSGGNVLSSQQQYIDKKKISTAQCSTYQTSNMNFEDNKLGKINKCSALVDRSCGSRINGKYYPLSYNINFNLPYTKETGLVYSSGLYNPIRSARRATPFPTGYNKPFPFVINSNECNTNYLQANNLQLLQDYYSDKNKTCGGFNPNKYKIYT